jgi:uncharacterized membrane protein
MVAAMHGRKLWDGVEERWRGLSGYGCQDLLGGLDPDEWLGIGVASSQVETDGVLKRPRERAQQQNAPAHLLGNGRTGSETDSRSKPMQPTSAARTRLILLSLSLCILPLTQASLTARAPPPADPRVIAADEGSMDTVTTVALVAVVSLGVGVASAQTEPGVILACKENRTGILSAVPNQLIATATCPAGTSRLNWNSARVKQVLELTSEATAINDIIDLPPTGFSPGDLYVFSERLYAKDAPTQQIGIADGHCTLIDPSSARFNCTIISSLAAGKNHNRRNAYPRA